MQLLPFIVSIPIILQCLPVSANTPDNIRRIVKGCHEYNFTKAQCAYTLATVEHETNRTWRPVREAYWLSESWRSSNLRYAPYYGRGYVQITWKTNYQRFEKILDIPLTQQPDLALQEDVALKILFLGLKHGSFTGYKLSDFIVTSLNFARDARRTVNGLDKADNIAQRARFWYSRLTVY